MHFLLVCKNANLVQLGHNMSIFDHNSMIPFSREPKKKEFEPQPLYVDLYPPSPPPKNEEEVKEERGVIIIELW